MSQIESINNTYTTATTGTQTAQQQNTAASLFGTMLSSLMSQSTSSIADFSEDSEDLYDTSYSGNNILSTFGTTLLQSLGGTGTSGTIAADKTSGTTESTETNNLMTMIVLMMLMSSQQDSGIGSDLLSSLFGGGTAGSLSSSLLGDTTSSTTSSLSNALNSYSNSALSTASSSLLSQYSSVSQLGLIPSDSWKTSNPLLVNHVGERNASTYRAVIDQFSVESNERYRVNKQGINDTYCNIFAWDVSRAMGAEIPHYINASTGEPVDADSTGNTLEMDANSVNDWLNSYGKNYGWVEVSAAEAQNYANQGMPTVTSWKNTNGHGHMQVVSPSLDGQYDQSRGVAIAQAGRHLYNYNYISSVYGEGTLGSVQYFAHI